MTKEDTVRMPTDRYWETKKLAEMTQDEWEALCDGCGKCCLHKLQDEDDGFVYYTSVACVMLDCETCRCKDYPNRTQHVPDCVQLSKENVETLTWMPSTCAYRLLAEGKGLPTWHPLITGTPEFNLYGRHVGAGYGNPRRGSSSRSDTLHCQMACLIIRHDRLQSPHSDIHGANPLVISCYAKVVDCA
ncbi:MAG: YcgN family cysteine cluster protein [Porticoccaceae bacterium]